MRELRDPQGALVPLAVGAAATAAAMIGYSLMQFLLGVDAPVSFLLAREILATVLLNGVIATPVYAIVRRVAAARAARGPAPPPAPRLHDRRPVAALARMMRSSTRRRESHEPPRRRSRRSSRCAWPCSAASPSCSSRSSSSACGTCRCSPATSTSQQARDNRVRELRVQAPRGDILDRNGHVLVENRAATVVQIDPESLPAAERDAAATWGQQVTARSRRPKGQKGPLIPIPPPATPHLETALQEPRRAC